MCDFGIFLFSKQKAAAKQQCDEKLNKEGQKMWYLISKTKITTKMNYAKLTTLPGYPRTYFL